MALITEKKQRIFETEGSWSDGSGDLLCLPSGTWRTDRPVLHQENCTYCGQCFLYCPTQCIHPATDAYLVELEFCKGCGICAHECPTEAIKMVAEGDAGDGSA